jgi:adenosylmethionine-8-amino-7-oxononanoate aminotransferase
VEPLVQGAGGMRFHSARFLRALCLLFRERGVPVIFDEVMTGFGRTGRFFAFQQAGFSPDLLCLSKGITGGILPLAVTIASNALFDSFLGADFQRALAHGHSYTANPVACAAALASLALHESTNSAGQVARINQRLALHLERLSTHPKVEKTRLLGGVAAFDLVQADPGYASESGQALSLALQQRGVLLRPLGNVVYLMPPYCISDAQIDRAFDAITGSLDQGAA